jgi:hypothetical protein
MFLKPVFHRKKRPFALAAGQPPRTAVKSHGVTELLLPGALLVTIQAQLLAPFMLVDFCLTAFFQ